MLLLVLWLPIFIIGLLCFIPFNKGRLLRIVALYFSLLEFFLSMCLWYKFDNLYMGFQFVSKFEWFSLLNVYYSVGIDGISLFLIILTTFLISVCILVSWNIFYRLKEFLILLFLIEFLLVNVFAVLDLLLFYIFFEAVLIPMFIIVGVWGSRERKIHAAYQFFMYTLVGSVLMLLCILYIRFKVGTTDLVILFNTEFGDQVQLILWFCFFLSFAIKVPMVPGHIWLPEAHVEAPTAGSVLLAGVLLKLGGYGFLRFSLPLFPYASLYFSPFIYCLSLLGILYTSLTCIRQIDLKKIIAYSSVAHMNYVTIGIFSNTLEGLEGSILLMLSHGIVSSALFICVGLLYERYNTRIITYYGGLGMYMPNFSLFLFLFILGNISFPGTSSFIGEMMVVSSIFRQNYFVGVSCAFLCILGGIYSIWLFNRLVGGTVGLMRVYKYSDLNRREYFILLYMSVIMLVSGIYPNYVAGTIHSSVSYLLYI